jgi:hypothetical protein
MWGIARFYRPTNGGLAVIVEQARWPSEFATICCAMGSNSAMRSRNLTYKFVTGSSNGGL